MRKSCAAALALVTLVTSVATVLAQSGEPDPSLQQRVEGLFQTGEMRLIFIGKIIEADRSVRPCRITCGIRWVVFSVENVTYGFSPGSTVRIAYDTGSLPPLFSSTSELLVFAVGGYSGWKSSISDLTPASDENIRVAKTIARSHLRRQVTQYHSHHTNWTKLSFVGTVQQPLPVPSQIPQPCKQARPFPVVFQVDKILSGNWPDATVSVVFSDCVPPPDPPVRLGAKLVVMAGITPRHQVVGYLKDVLPVDTVGTVTNKLAQDTH